MARAAKPAPAKARTATPAPPPAPEADTPAADPALLIALKAFEAAHGVSLELPPPAAFTPGAVVLINTTSPISAERLVAEARSLPGFRDVRLLPSKIELELVVPAPPEG